MRKLLPLIAFVLIGCGINPGTNPDPVDITGTVTLNNKPLSDVTFNLQPTGTGTQAALPVKGGEFKGKVTPGRYTYFISEGTKAAAFKSVPSKYQLGSMDRQVDVAAGTKLEIKLD